MGTTGMGGHDASRLDRWRAGWRVSLRMARRDVRRHRGRSLLVVIMVGLPVLLLTAGTTLWFTDDLDAGERLPFQLGTTQGYVVPPQPTQLRQLLDPFQQEGWPDDAPPPAARPVPGLTAGSEAPALAALLRARLVEVTSVPATIRSGDHFISGSALGVDTSAPALLAPRVALDSGRWPATPGEALVTVEGLANGLPRSGSVGLRVLSSDGEAPERTVTIVGVGRGFDAQGGQYVQQTDLVTTPLVSDYAQRQFLVDRPEPIAWGEVERLNTYGVGVFSRFVAEHPETMTRHSDTSSDDAIVLVVAVAALGLVLLTTLLAGPAFAVSAARQRHALALAASNGATTRQLRRTVLAQALVLGVLSALVGAAAGVAGGVGAVQVTRLVRPDLFFGPLQVPWLAVGGVAVAAVVSSVVAALVPSRGLGRLDVVSVLRGQSLSPRLRRRVPAVGAVLVVAGAVAVTWASFGNPTQRVWVFVAGSLAIVVGSLLVVPLALALVGRGANRLPLPLRMAAREAGRQRGRATPTVAAIMGGAAVLAVVCIGLQADTVRSARDHVAVVRDGQGVVQGGLTPDRLVDLQRVVDQNAPEAHSLLLQGLTDYGQQGGSGMLAAMRPGCTLAQIVPQPIGGDVATPLNVPCATASSFGRDFSGTSLLAADPRRLADFMSLSAAQRDALARGAVAVVDPADVADLALPGPGDHMIDDLETLRPVVLDENRGTASFARWQQRPGTTDTAAPPAPTSVETVTLPVVHVSRQQWNRAVQVYMAGSPAGIMATATAQRLGLPVVPQSLLVRADGGISPETEARVTDALRATQGDASLAVERGFQRDDGLALAIVFGVIGLVILVATLIATALSQTENAPLLGTLAAVGATRRTRRALAGAQALYLGLLGAALGLLVGLAPGIGLARIVLTTVTDDGTRVLPGVIPVPWLQILLPVVLVPLVAGALAWVSIRRAPVVVRRTT